MTAVVRRIVSVLLLLPLAALPARADLDADELREAGLEPTVASLRRYLKNLAPDAETRRRIARLTGFLGSRDATERDAAVRALRDLGAAAIADLRLAATSSDPEVRRRARRLLLRTNDLVRSDLLHRVMKVIAERELRGLTEEILNAITVCGDRHVRFAARRALRATVSKDDAGVLRTALRDPSPEVRAAAATALAGALGERASADLVALLDDDADVTRIAAARGLADFGDRACLRPLVVLLSARHDGARQSSVEALRLISGLEFGYSAFHGPVERAPAIARWTEWVERHGATATWITPLGAATGFLGRTLIALYEESTVIELDKSMREAWRLESIRFPWACAGLRNGHRILGVFSERRVVEYGTDGEAVWRSEALLGRPSSVQRLENDHTLLTFGPSVEAVLELDGAGSPAWRVNVTGKPTDARRVGGGRTLVTLNKAGAVVEIDRSGRELWRLDGLRSPYSARRLANGNTLVAEMGGRIVELTRSGKVAWTHQAGRNCCVAQRLPTGNTLYADQTGVHEVDPNGKEVWHYKAKGWIWVCRY